MVVLGTFLEHCLFGFIPPCCCADGQSFSAFFSSDMVFEQLRDNHMCDEIDDLFSIVDS